MSETQDYVCLGCAKELGLLDETPVEIKDPIERCFECGLNLMKRQGFPAG